MTSEDREIFCAAEASIQRVLRNYVHVRLMLDGAGVGAINPNEIRCLGFTTLGDMRTWKMEVEKAAMRTDRAIGLRCSKMIRGTLHAESLQLLGDRLVVGLRGRRLAEAHHSTVDSIKTRYERCVAVMWTELFAADIDDDYRQRPAPIVEEAPVRYATEEAIAAAEAAAVAAEHAPAEAAA